MDDTEVTAEDMAAQVEPANGEEGAVAAKRGGWTRSVGYPSISYPEALEYTRLNYARNRTHFVDRDTLAIAEGFKSGTSGVACSVLSTQRKYGLLEAENKLLRTSTDAMRVLEEGPMVHRDIVLAQAAAPEVFQKLIEKFDGVVPSRGAAVVFLRTECGLDNDAPEKAFRAFAFTAKYIEETFGPDTGFPIMNPNNLDELEALPSVGTRVLAKSAEKKAAPRMPASPARQSVVSSASSEAPVHVKIQPRPVAVVEPAPTATTAPAPVRVFADQPVGRKLLLRLPVDAGGVEVYADGVTLTPAQVKAVSDVLWPVLHPDLAAVA